MGCGWLLRLSTAILRNAKDPGFGPTSGKADPTLQVSGLPSISLQTLCGRVQRLQSQKHTPGCQRPSDCPVVWASLTPVKVRFGNLAMLFISLVLSLWHSRFGGGKGFQIVLRDEAFCDTAVGGEGMDTPWNFSRLQDACDCDTLDLLMWVILPECHRALIWFPVLLGGADLVLFAFFSGTL